MQLYSHVCGILLTSTAYFVVYGVLTRNHPQVFPQVTLPAILSGVMWALGTPHRNATQRTLNVT